MPSKPPTHRPSRTPGRTHATDRAKRQDRERGSSNARGYGYHWRKLRAVVLAEEPLCRACLARGRTTPAEHVDHITPKAEGGTDERTNLQALCRGCHSRKTATEDGGFGRPNIHQTSEKWSGRSDIGKAPG